MAPGPGAYNPSIGAAKENIGGVRIGTASRDQRGAMSNTLDTPGPGNYNISSHLNTHSYGFGSGVRQKMSQDKTPGPGHYKLPYHVAEVPRYFLPDKPENLRFV